MPLPRDSELEYVIGLVVLVVYATWRSFQPIRFAEETGVFIWVLLEVAVHTLVVAGTGYWTSPYVFSLLTAIIVAGFSRGFRFAFLIGGASAIAVAIPYHVDPGVATRDAIRTTTQWSVELLLVAAVAGYGRRFWGESEERHLLALDRLGRLTEANNLLYSLHRLAQALPASLDLEEVLDSSVGRLRSLVDATVIAVFLPDETSSQWLVARQHGTRLPPVLDPALLPSHVADATRGRATVTIEDLQPPTGRGMSIRSRSGIYAPLSARGALVGVLAIEHDEPQHFTTRDLNVLSGFVEPVGLAIDNARWFQRLRTVSADEERTRIARDLHDRVGQSLAYLTFELERLERHAESETARESLGQLRQDLRSVVGEVRETLYDLRTDVSETEDLPTILEHFLDRVRERTELEIRSTYQAKVRLPLPQEREMWRVAQEAVTNVERHASASIIRVSWRCDIKKAELVVADNGTGFDRGKVGRLDSYGMLGMRERAASVGASLDVDSVPGRGTTVRCTLRRV